MRKSILNFSILVGIVLITILACMGKSKKADETVVPVAATAIMDSTDLVSRGAYLVNSIGCADCHSPKSMGANGPEIIPELDLSGFPSNGTVPPIDLNSISNGWIMFNPDGTSHLGPWGQSFAANLTSDPSGIGNWTEENFIRAIRKGKYKGLENSRDLLPLMPWYFYNNLTDEDLSSIYYYLKTTKPVSNIVPPPISMEDLKQNLSAR
ncbi:c-type cytochrome [Arenibacter sp. BSSL-BM3]|uniref:C-type cytochrome n=1 Tax=Arenibacter arenosicollis TaxID=2762274 RepID=A0ABR7QKL7_9FLAO|nr:c-type cytochrome [Arenibacter arenosicollis]MBC8767733.1 c-type cytochrome [Arenibacter arenosicollis]